MASDRVHLVVAVVLAALWPRPEDLASASIVAIPTLQLSNATPTRQDEEGVRADLKAELSLRNLLWARPPDQGATPVNVSLAVRHITLNEMQSTMSVSATVTIEWNDSRIRDAWRKSERYSSIPRAHVSRGDIWFPSIVLKNGVAGRAETLLDESSTATVHADGRAVWETTTVLETFCRLDLRRWPFERHACAVQLGSWTHAADELRVARANQSLQFDRLLGELELEEIASEVTPVLNEGSDGATRLFDVVTYRVTVRREPGTHSAVVYAPASVVVILCLATFLLPPRASEKIVLGGVNAVLICLFLIYFAHSLPVLTNQTPFIVVFYSTSLYLVCVSLVIAVVVLNIARLPHSRGLPWTLKKVLTGPCGRFLLLSGYIDQIMGIDHGPCSGLQEEIPVVQDDEISLGEGSNNAGRRDGRDGAAGRAEIGSRDANPHHDWMLLAAALDRSLFIVYSMIFIIIACVLHV